MFRLTHFQTQMTKARNDNSSIYTNHISPGDHQVLPAQHHFKKKASSQTKKCIICNDKIKHNGNSSYGSESSRNKGATHDCAPTNNRFNVHPPTNYAATRINKDPSFLPTIISQPAHSNQLNKQDYPHDTMHAQKSNIREHNDINNDPFLLSPSNMCGDIFQEINTSTCMILQIEPMTNHAHNMPCKATNGGQQVLSAQHQSSKKVHSQTRPK